MTAQIEQLEVNRLMQTLFIKGISLAICLTITGCSYNYIYKPKKDTDSYFLLDPINATDTLSVLVEVPFSSRDRKTIQVFVQTKIPQRSRILNLEVELKTNDNIFHQKKVELEWSLPPIVNNSSLYDSAVVKSSFDKLADKLKYSHLTSSIKNDSSKLNYTIFKYTLNSDNPISEKELTFTCRIEFMRNGRLVKHESETKLYVYKQRQRIRIG